MTMKFIASAFPTTTVTTFSNIPQTYDDLLLVYGLKSLSTSGDGYGAIYVQMNYSSGNHGDYGMIANGGSGSYTNAASYVNTLNSSKVEWHTSQYPGNAGGTGNFTNQSLYIPNYRSSFKKMGISYAGMVPHGSLSRTRYLGTIWNNTAAITSIRVQGWNDAFVTGSYLYLYGITKAS
jgi:hypothetical protein